jgi:hypothetical protein
LILVRRPRTVKKLELAFSLGFTSKAQRACPWRKFLVTPARKFLRPRLSHIPELQQDALYAGIFRKDLVLLENLLSSGISGMRMDGVK